MKNKTLTIMGIALFLSLMANMFFLGLWLGGGSYATEAVTTEISTGESHQAAKLQDIDKDFRKLMPDADKKVIRQHMRKIKTDLKQQKQSYIEARKAVRQAMHAEPFDQQKLQQALENERIQRQTMQQMINSSRHEMAAKLSPEGRKAFAQMEERLTERGGYRRLKHDEKGSFNDLRRQRLQKYREYRRQQQQE